MIVNNHEFEIFVSMWNLPAKGAITSVVQCLVNKHWSFPRFWRAQFQEKTESSIFEDSELFAQNALSERQSLCNFWRFVLRYSR